MKNIQLLNKIAKIGLENFDAENYCIGDNIVNPDGILVRSADMQSYEFNKELKAIARAGAGVNNIPVERCAQEGIVVFNTPGANANGVKELAIAALLLASRGIAQGNAWVNSQIGNPDIAKMVEKEKSKFAGQEVYGKTLGVIGLGAIGGKVANAATSIGMNVVGYDPYITVDAAWHLSRAIKQAKSYDEIFNQCDYISIHMPATEETKGMFNAETFGKMKNGVRFINLSRADLVNSADLVAAVKSGKIASYVTDFPVPEIIGQDDHIICIPHLGASTEESEDNCAIMAVKQLAEYLENGNITNSVNYPNCSLPHTANSRICVMHKNVPSVIAKISSVVANKGLNIENFLNKSKKEYAYTIVEIDGEVSKEVIDEINSLEEVIKTNQY